MKTLGEHTYELGVDLMRLYSAHDNVANTGAELRRLEFMRRPVVLHTINRISKEDNNGTVS